MNTLSTLAAAKAAAADTGHDTEPWWRYPLLWLVIGGPAIVVVASFFTLYLALHTPDPLTHTGAVEAGEAEHSAVDKRMLPAETGRNHAATPPRSMETGKAIKP